MTLVALAMLGACGGATGPSGPTYYAENILDFQPAWSPDGTLIAYFRESRDQFLVGGIYVIPATGGTPDSVHVYAEFPAWSWDSRYLAVYSDVDGQIHVHERGSWREVAATTGPGFHLRPQWHPDNRHIFYYVPSGPDSLLGIWRFDMATGISDRSVITRGGSPAPDPSGQYFVYYRGAALRKASLSTGIESVLIEFDDYDDGPSDARTPRFSNDGTRILFWSVGKLLQNVRGMWEFTLADSSLEHVLSNSIYASYSPTGDSLVYSPETGDAPEGLGLLWIFDRNTGERSQLTTKY